MNKQILASSIMCLLWIGASVFSAETDKNKDQKPEEPTARGSVMREEFTPGSWTLAVVPDIQNQTHFCPGVSMAQTAWLIQNRQRFNIPYALYLGDLTNHDAPWQWENCQAAISLLDGKLPYALVTGNHDYHPDGASRDTRINDYFPVKNFADWPTFGGVMEEGRIENSYHLFEAGGRKWIVIALEWAPRDKTVDWANTIMDIYSDRCGILITHAYLFDDSLRYDHKTRQQRWNPHDYKTPPPVNDGQELWDKLVRKHNFVFVLCGHVCNSGVGYQAEKNDAGQTVHQILSNYQFRDYGGEGYLRLMEFLPDGKTVKIRTYSPLWDRLLTSPQQQFTLELDLLPAKANKETVSVDQTP